MSLFFRAENINSAATSIAVSSFEPFIDPNAPDAETLTRKRTVISRSSRNCLTNGTFERAVVFQSILSTSSPGWYSRTVSNSIPCPRNTLLYWPTNSASTMRLARI